MSCVAPTSDLINLVNQPFFQMTASEIVCAYYRYPYTAITGYI